jgi:membrane protein YdbS with pleckstrin-like domain
MALIPCPECSRQISTAAVACPHCGFPVASAKPDGGSLAPRQALANPSPEAEETLWEARPTALLLFGQILRTVLLLAVVAMLDWAARRFLFPELQVSPRLLTTIRGFVLVLVVVVVAARLVEALVQVKTTRWRLTNQRLVIETGVLSRSLDNVDVRTVDDTKYRQSIAGRLLGFGTVVVISKDRTNPVLTLPGVTEPRKVQELIRATAYKVSQGQLFMREA